MDPTAASSSLASPASEGKPRKTNKARQQRRPKKTTTPTTPTTSTTSTPPAMLNPHARVFDPLSQGAANASASSSSYAPSVRRVAKSAATASKSAAPVETQVPQRHSRENSARQQRPKGNSQASVQAEQRATRERSRQVQSDSQQILDLKDKISAQLTSNSYECMICYDPVQRKDRVWSCAKSCFALFHAKCISAWANSSSLSPANPALTQRPEWRCPGCQFRYSEAPYPSCFCGRTEHPGPRVMNAIPHSCGDQCLKIRNCTHKCTSPCHPGPCDKCELMAPPMECYCKKVVLKFRCADVDEAMDLSCGQTCGSLLSCGKHTCPDPCHEGPCAPCNEMLEVDCVCGKCSTSVPCDYEVKGEIFQCSEPCEVAFPCGAHVCEEVCHEHVEGALCASDPLQIVTCPCEAETVVSLLGGKNREKCTDEVPVCENTCAKTLKCGHICTAQCHNGECAPCSYKITLPCRCGKSQSTLLCGDIKLNDDGGYQIQLCERVCALKRSCKRHVCGNVCCPADLAAHYCELQCGKTLKCGSHACQMACGHTERCHDCFEGVSFEELTCTCGSSVTYPPIPCGTAPPKCNRPCRLPLACGHISYSSHACHPRTEPCPNCMIFVERPCACGKTVLKNVPCSRTVAPSCGAPCLKLVPGCLHPCKRACHTGECIDATNMCTEKCSRSRPICGHICLYPCHRKNFCTEDKPCKQPVLDTCPCGHKTTHAPCGAWKSHPGRSNGSSRLQCDDTCAVIKRNKALAEALEIDTAVPSPVATSESNPVADGAASAATTGTPPILNTDLPTSTLSLPPSTLLEPLETQLHILKYAYQNLVWTRTVEKVLHDFVHDPTKPTHHYKCSKAQGIRFIVALVPYYGLDAEVVDASWGAGKMSVILRKRVRGKACKVPDVLCSAIAPGYQAILKEMMAGGKGGAGSVRGTPVVGDEGGECEDVGRTDSPFDATAAPVSVLKTAVNGYKITNLRPTLEDADLCAVIEPVVGCRVEITWLVESATNDCVVQLVSGEGDAVDMSRVEQVLMKHGDTLVGEVVMQGLAEGIEMCWMNHKRVVVSVEEIVGGSKKGRKTAVVQRNVVGIGKESKFSALMMEGEGEDEDE
ncbi:FKBP12-associated protein [Podochytrium sp. JEL0797]|nr:FKBP12-associated protein [Podochytrium sp. JEL0797]